MHWHKITVADLVVKSLGEMKILSNAVTYNKATIQDRKDKA
jgi:hypothetical protein